jgi:hypothetical protein
LMHFLGELWEVLMKVWNLILSIKTLTSYHVNTRTCWTICTSHCFTASATHCTSSGKVLAPLVSIFILINRKRRSISSCVWPFIKKETRISRNNFLDIIQVHSANSHWFLFSRQQLSACHAMSMVHCICHVSLDWPVGKELEAKVAVHRAKSTATQLYLGWNFCEYLHGTWRISLCSCSDSKRQTHEIPRTVCTYVSWVDIVVASSHFDPCHPLSNSGKRWSCFVTNLSWSSTNAFPSQRCVDGILS